MKNRNYPLAYFSAILLAIALPCSVVNGVRPAAQTSLVDGARGTIQAASHKIHVNDPAIATKFVAEGGRFIANYGSFQLLEISTTNSSLLNHPAVEIHDEHNLVLLNAARLDTRKSETKALRKPLGQFQGKHLHLVQYAGPIQPAWNEGMIKAGVQVITYIPHNTYLIYSDAQSLAQFQKITAADPRVQWDGEYLDEYKIHPSARALDYLGHPREIGTELFAIQLVADEDANPGTLKLIERLKQGLIKRQDYSLNYLNLIVPLLPRDLAEISRQPEVVSIQPWLTPQKFCERQDQIVAGNLSGNSPSGPGYLAWLAGKGFTQDQFNASGFVVDLSDSGLDNGTIMPNHFGLHEKGMITNSSRVIYNRLEGTPNRGSSLKGCDGHGTLNSHIIAGYDNLTNGFPHTDSGGFHYGLGVCPFVRIGSSVIFDPYSFTHPNYANLQSQAYHDGARISNNSWGAAGSSYDIDAQSFDILVRDAQPTNSTYSVPGNQEMVIVFAPANGGPQASTIGSPSVAKNVLSVGAGESVQLLGGDDGCGNTDFQTDSASDMTSFSGRGPCPDGRHKPDIVAPGTHVSGGVVQSSIPGPNGTADPCFTGYFICGGPNDPFYPSGQQFFTVSSGTSHAAPCVSGGCALLRQYFINNFTNPPSPAMTKAYLMNSARYLTGAGANDTLWSDSQGMGELNLGFAFDGTPRVLRDELPADLFTASGQTRVYTGTISDTNKPFRVTLAWTDAPGSTTGNPWNNNLDLTVTVGGIIYKGNVFRGQYSAPGGAADLMNNAESVFLPAGVSGNFAVRVSAANINSDGVPGNGNPLDQDFALVVYNAVETNAAVIAGIGSTLITEGCSPTNGVIDPGESVAVNFVLQNVGSIDSSNIVASLLTSGGVNWPSGAQSFGALTSGGSSVSRSFTFTASGNCGQTIYATLQLQDGSVDLGTAVFPLQLGKFTSLTPLTQNFDTVVAPALPSGWITAASGAQTNWVTASAVADGLPNAAFSAAPAAVGINELLTPAFSITTPAAQLTFRNDYNFEADSNNASLGYDGGVLEIKVSTNSFIDILTAGGSFANGGYSRTISASRQNPLAGRPAWSGDSGGFNTTLVNLPSSAAGQTVQFKWRCGTDNTNKSSGWYIDTISISDGSFACCISSADLAINQLASPSPATVGQSLSFNLSITNLGSASASSVTATDSLPSNVTFVSASPGCVNIGGNVVCSLGTMAGGTGTNLSIVVSPTQPGLITNVVSLFSPTPDPNASNNFVAAVIMVQAPPIITTSPSNQTVALGDTAGFFVTAEGTMPLAYQWSFNGTNLVAATDNTLLLTNVQSSASGTYLVTVTNVAGAVTSSPALLTVLVPPAITSITMEQTGFSISFIGESSLHYNLEYKDALTDANWISILPPALGTGSLMSLQDTNPPAASRFYRIRCQ